MNLTLIAFDDFTDLDLFLPWDLLCRVQKPGWSVRILGEQAHHRSKSGLVIPMHGDYAETKNADVVLFSSGPQTRVKCLDAKFLGRFDLNPQKQLIGSLCSGALILAALGLLEGKEATTYPTAKEMLAGFGVKVVDRPFVRNGNVATAAGCLAALDLVKWVVDETLGELESARVLASVQPVGVPFAPIRA